MHTNQKYMLTVTYESVLGIKTYTYYSNSAYIHYIKHIIIQNKKKPRKL